MKFILPKQYTGKIVKKEKLAKFVIKLTLESNKPLVFRAGQYASLIIGQYRRPVSFATPPDVALFEFLLDISPGGIASRWCEQVKTGDTIDFLSPYGQFILETNNRPRILIATGTGIAPFKAQLLKDQMKQITFLYFGASPKLHQKMDKEFESITMRQPHFEFIPVCHKPSAGWYGVVGHVVDVVLVRTKNISQYDFYVCGGPDLIEEAMSKLAVRKILRERIHIEQFTNHQISYI